MWWRRCGPSNDWASAALERFYGVADAPADPADALALAQRALVATSATANPFYWAGLVVAEGSQ